MSTIHLGRSRTIPVSAADGSTIAGLTATSSNPNAVTATVNADNTVTRHAALAGSSASITYTAPGFTSVQELVNVPQPIALVLGTDGPEV